MSWFVAHLGAYFGAGLATAGLDWPLTDVLAEAIRRTAADHGPDCDTSHPLGPAATVSAARITGDRLDWLVLGDATFAWQLVDGTTDAVTDDRLAELKGGPVVVADVRRYAPDYVISVRNQPGGFWVASTDPDAAHQALTGSLPVDQVDKVGLYSDGNADPDLTQWRGKPHDDATAIIARIDRSDSSQLP